MRFHKFDKMMARESYLLYFFFHFTLTFSIIQDSIPVSFFNILLICMTNNIPTAKNTPTASPIANMDPIKPNSPKYTTGSLV